MQTHPAYFGLYHIIHLKSCHPQTGRGKEVRHHGFTLNIFLSVMASVVAYYICKWLDGEK